ncbi:MAG: glutamate-1-semialdehyde 2,1-aminomutase [Burkholderiales bacterium]
MRVTSGLLRSAFLPCLSAVPSRNQELFDRSCRVIPGGVNSPVRAFDGVGGSPRIFHCGEGARVWDVEGREYVDYVGSWGPLIAGHANPEVVAAITETAAKGLSFGTPTELELQMAELLCRLLPSLEQVRLVSSGTEATMSAIRLARGFTGRKRIIKFEGCYHGHADSLLVKAGSGALTFNQPSSAGVPSEVAATTIVLGYNETAQVVGTFDELGSEIAAVIVEPIAGNMNLVLPDPGFLLALREQCARHGALLIFDEVMTGFRVGPQGAQGIYNITPDLTTLGKVIGGGMPVGAFGGRREIMQLLAPLGAVYQAGTLSGNPVALAAGLATLKLTQTAGFFEKLAVIAAALIDGLEQVASDSGFLLSAQAIGGMFGIYFRPAPPQSFAQVMECDIALFARFFHAMLQRGFYFAPSAFEAGFVSSAHTPEQVQRTIAAAREVFHELREWKR